jgi:hypothetical protein
MCNFKKGNEMEIITQKPIEWSKNKWKGYKRRMKQIDPDIIFYTVPVPEIGIILEEIPINDLKYSESNSARVNKLIYLIHADGPTCKECGIVGTHFKRTIHNDKNEHVDLYSDDDKLLTIDHIIPKSKGGSDDLGNLQILCFTCNVRKSNKYDGDQNGK